MICSCSMIKRRNRSGAGEDSWAIEVRRAIASSATDPSAAVSSASLLSK